MLVYHQPNQGVSVARNKGLEFAKGEFVCFLDSDDTYEPEFLAEMLKRQQQTNGEVIYCGFNRVNKLGKKVGGPKHFAEGQILPLYFLDRNYFSFSCLLIKRDFLLKNSILFDKELTASEDDLFSVQLFAQTKVYAVKKYLFNYWYRACSARNSKKDDHTCLVQISAYKKIVQHMEDNYHLEAKEQIICTLKYKILECKTDYLYEKFLNLEFSTIKAQINNSDFMEFFAQYKNQINKSYLKKITYITSKNKIKQFCGYVCYKFLRMNAKELTG